MERAFKIYVTRKDGEGLSVMHPKHYKMRFQACMDTIFEATSSDTARLASRNPSSQSLHGLAAAAAVAPFALSTVSEEVHNPLLAAASTGADAAKACKTKRVKAKEPVSIVPAALPGSLDDSFAEYGDHLDKSGAAEEYDML